MSSLLSQTILSLVLCSNHKVAAEDTFYNIRDAIAYYAPKKKGEKT